MMSAAIFDKTQEIYGTDAEALIKTFGITRGYANSNHPRFALTKLRVGQQNVRQNDRTAVFNPALIRRMNVVFNGNQISPQGLHHLKERTAEALKLLELMRCLYSNKMDHQFTIGKQGNIKIF